MGLPGEQGVISCPHKIINSLWKHHNLTLLKQTETLGRGSVMCRTLSCGAAAGRAKMLVCTAETKMVIWKTGRERLCKSSRKWLFNSLTEMMMYIFFQFNLLSCLLIVFIFINNYFIFFNNTGPVVFLLILVTFWKRNLIFAPVFSTLASLSSCNPSQPKLEKKETNKQNKSNPVFVNLFCRTFHEMGKKSRIILLKPAAGRENKLLVFTFKNPF